MNLFSVPIFFIIFRESLEAAIIVSVLLAFIHQSLSDTPQLQRKYKHQIYFGSALGMAVCLAIGGAFIAVWYTVAKDLWGSTEEIWEGVFALIACILITVIGLGMLRIHDIQAKWHSKLESELDKSAGSKYGMFILPFITVLREGLEAVVFVGGVSLSEPATSFPIAVVVGLLCGGLVGYLIYKSGNFMKIEYFLIASTCILYLISAGLFSRSIWYFEQYKWNRLVGGDAAELGSGPGTYDIRQSVWHVNCCSSESNSGWGIFNAVLGWVNSATFGSVTGYCLYWLMVVILLSVSRWREGNLGRRSMLHNRPVTDPCLPATSLEKTITSEGLI
ncbi:Plasma membrane iron permease [Neolecta irregularis DAH-3]|uniref:Plasma membrane iron permease n=1 Tax=Neolecta irregularis (strain DAH-3) TaxID=1198029 RepID=A0A1U7LVF7_NEOID|nr:Plasma membrane iron permease [Neolecta irregularis DAH-3]|eukprot:OLL26532.1 Plasma membrane iron permease [Neolecta irregularis DAH-3]